MKSNIEEIVKQYKEIFPIEKEKLQKLNIFLEENKNNYNNLFNRKNFDGHITASGYIFSVEEKKILLLEHKQLKVYVQPGGHVELDDDTILDSAKREIFEETGLNDIKLVNPSNNIYVPFNINTHYIPENNKKNEKEHYHHDFSYLFTINSIKDIKIDFNESNSFKWCSIKKFENRNEVRKKLINFLQI